MEMSNIVEKQQIENRAIEMSNTIENKQTENGGMKMNNKIENKQVENEGVEMGKTNIELNKNQIVIYKPGFVDAAYDTITIGASVNIEGVSYTFEFGITRNKKELLILATCQDTDIRNLTSKHPDVLKDMMNHEPICKMLTACFEKAIADIYNEMTQEIFELESVHFEDESLNDIALKNILELKEMFIGSEYPKRWIFE